MTKTSPARAPTGHTRLRRLSGALLAIAAGSILALARAPNAAAPAQAPLTGSLRFEANQGQLDERVRFLSRGPGYGLYLTRTGATLALRGTGGAPAVMTMRFVGGRPVEPAGGQLLAGTSNYLVGNEPARWRTGVASYGTVRYPEVWPGVDVVYYGNGQRELEYDVVVAPGADPGQVGISFEGIAGATVDGAGNAVLALTGGAALRKAPPIAYQETGAGERLPVLASYQIRGDGSLGFRVGDYDRDRPLVIDPVLFFSTYLGGSNSDGTAGMAVDASGNIYVTGYTLSTNFPSASPAQGANAGSHDLFVSKLSSNGSSLIYSTYLGGSGEDRPTGIAIDGGGNVHVTGFTLSTNFPTAAPLQETNAGAHDAFVVKLNPAGSALVYGTYLGGAGTDAAYGIAVDSGGAAYVAGYTFSTGFPTAAPLQGALVGTTDAFVSKLNAAGSALVYSSYLGGNSDEVANGIAVDVVGSAYLVGWTASTNFPTLAPIQSALSGASDAFVTRLNTAGSALSYSSYLGGSGADVGQAIGVDGAGQTYLAGYTTSSNFPTASAAQAAFGGTYDGFVTKLSTSGSSVVFSTYLGGSFYDRINALTVGPDGRASVAGYTESLDFPRAAPLQASHGGGLGDAFLSTLTGSGTAISFSTYLGGGSDDNAHAVAANTSSLYVAGTTRSSNFPVQQALQGTLAGGPWDAFVTRVLAQQPAPIPAASPVTRLALAGLLVGLILALAPRRRQGQSSESI